MPYWDLSSEQLQADVEALTKLLQASASAPPAPTPAAAASHPPAPKSDSTHVSAADRVEEDGSAGASIDAVGGQGEKRPVRSMRDSSTTMTPSVLPCGGGGGGGGGHTDMESGNTSEDGVTALDDLDDDDDMDTPLATSPNVDAISSLQRKLQMVQESSQQVIHSYKRSNSRPQRASGTQISGSESFSSASSSPTKPQRAAPAPTSLTEDLEREGRVGEAAPMSPAKHLLSPSDSGSCDASPVVVLYSRGTHKAGEICTTAMEPPGDYGHTPEKDSRASRQSESTIDGDVPTPCPPQGDLSQQRSSHTHEEDRAATSVGDNPPSSPKISPAAGVSGGIGQEPFIFDDDDALVSAPVLKEGFLMKRGYVNTALQRRWCVLRGKVIYFYKQYRDKSVRGTINCDRASVEIAVSKMESMPFSFYIHTPHDKSVRSLPDELCST